MTIGQDCIVGISGEAVQAHVAQCLRKLGGRFR